MRSRVDWLGIGLLSLALTLITPAALAVQLRKLTLEERVSLADVVVIGKAISGPNTPCFGHYKCARIQIQTYLKGSGAANLRMFTNGPIAEASPACCKVGSHNLLFLKHATVAPEFFETVNGPNGTYLLDAH